MIAIDERIEHSPSRMFEVKRDHESVSKKVLMKRSGSCIGMRSVPGPFKGWSELKEERQVNKRVGCA